MGRVKWEESGEKRLKQRRAAADRVRLLSVAHAKRGPRSLAIIYAFICPCAPASSTKRRVCAVLTGLPDLNGGHTVYFSVDCGRQRAGAGAASSH